MHILITANTSWNLVNFRYGLIEALINDGHKVTILAVDDLKSADLISLGCHFINLKMDLKGLSPHRNLGLVYRFLTHFRREKPDVILSYTIKNNIFGALAARLLRIPFLPNITGLGTAFLSGPLLQKIAEWLYRFSFKNIPTVFFQNKDDSNLFLNAGLVQDNQICIIPGSGIDLDQFQISQSPDRGTSAHFLLIARLIRDKGIFEYVDAAKMIRAQYPDAKFQLLGALGADNRSAIDKDTVEDWVNEGIVEYLGETNDVKPFINAADCVVLPSYREGAPRTLIEAAAMARPVIATNVPGCCEVVAHGKTGYLCMVKSSDSLSQAFMNFLSLPQSEREKMGRAGRTKIELEYDQKLVIDAYRTMISRCTNE